MRTHTRLLVLTFVIAAFCAVAIAQIAGAPQFSADMQMKMNRGENMSGKIYFGGQQFRMDMSAEGHQTQMITDLAAKKTYMVMPQQRMYMEHDLNQAMQRGRGGRMPDMKPRDPRNPCGDDTHYTCTKIGSESVNGRSTDKWDFKDKATGKHQMFLWLDQKIPMAIRTQTDDMQMDLTNVKEGPQDASLFQVPSGYRKMGGMGMGMGMPGGMPPDKDQD